MDDITLTGDFFTDFPAIYVTIINNNDDITLYTGQARSLYFIKRRIFHHTLLLISLIYQNAQDIVFLQICLISE